MTPASQQDEVYLMQVAHAKQLPASLRQTHYNNPHVAKASLFTCHNACVCIHLGLGDWTGHDEVLVILSRP